MNIHLPFLKHNRGDELDSSLFVFFSTLSQLLLPQIWPEDFESPCTFIFTKSLKKIMQEIAIRCHACA
jgi:hypothetical protein